MASRSHPIVIFLDRNSFLLYQDFLPNVWQFPFPEDLVRHLEVINKDQLVELIFSFLKTNKIAPTSLIIILSDSVVFQKDFAPIQQGSPQGLADQEKEIQQFLENVPFEYSMAKVIGGTRIAATNKELLENIILPFRKLGCILEGVVPSFVYDGKIDFSQGLTPDSAKAILQNPDLLRMGNMLVGQKEVEVKKEPVDDKGHSDSLKEKPKNTMQIVLAVIFVFLVIVLAVVYFAMGNSDDTPMPSNTNGSQSSKLPVSALTPIQSGLTPTIDVMPTKTIVASPSAILSDIKTTIVVNSETEAVGNILKRRLEQLGLSVTLSVAATTNPARSSILFSKTIDSQVRQKVTDEVRKILIDVSVDESQSLEDLSISIVVGAAL